MNAHEMGRAGVGFVAAELERVTAQRDEAVRLLTELHALVWGECPSLLDALSDGNDRLDIAIREYLERMK